MNKQLNKIKLNTMVETKQQDQTSILPHFERYNRLSYSQNNIKYTMSLTKSEASKMYFSCVNRHLTPTNKQKCNATGIYNQETKKYTTKKVHTIYCSVNTSSEVSVIDHYDTQRKLLLNELESNPRLKKSEAMDLLKKDNATREVKEKYIPLNYDQVRYIINSYRKDNGIQRNDSVQEIRILTNDNSLFLRYNSSFYGIYKGKFIYRIFKYGKHYTVYVIIIFLLLIN